MIISYPILGKNCQYVKFFFKYSKYIRKSYENVYGKKKPSGVVEKEGRGGRSEAMKKRDIKTVLQHINRYPRVESHYCRQKSSKEYLSPQLSITKMFDMYLKEYEHKDPASFNSYRISFKSLNVSVHKPKKTNALRAIPIIALTKLLKAILNRLMRSTKMKRKKLEKLKKK
ncbi:unnamed protein product [Acanthoscelides obtectus]|uniref:Uncharacterized protein n=1 Tax=Acanthoscelides obtectus TaxID=200917 RepID=A0A9P0KGK2_ACAOB|nr:unnamed protein product [Acanthoscelides obtectus]CAK1650988.1 hypothetical protein AOBTE_LOCUS17002 [Acanthoscelides obtectus]